MEPTPTTARRAKARRARVGDLIRPTTQAVHSWNVWAPDTHTRDLWTNPVTALDGTGGVDLTSRDGREGTIEHHEYRVVRRKVRTVKEAIRLITRSGRRDADEIAVFLEREGIKAKQVCAHGCALSLWFIKVLNLEAFGAAVASGQFNIYHDQTGQHFTVYTLPNNLNTFYRNFDNGHYPNLVAEKD